MKPSKLMKSLETLVKTNRPIWIWGPPGIGKSDIVRQLAEKMGVQLEDVRATTLDAVDIRGIPQIVQSEKSRKTTWAPPEFLPESGSGILFLDELAQAPMDVQSALLQLTLERQLGSYRLPDGWKIIAASNRPEDKAGVRQIITPLLRRFIHLNLETDTEDWLWWAASHGVEQHVRFFIAFRPERLFDSSPAPQVNTGWPAPRSWHMLSDLLTAWESWQSELDDPVLMENIAGCVGSGCAAEFITYCKYEDQIPTAQQILENAEKITIPKEIAVVWAMIGTVCDFVRHNESNKTLDRAMTFAGRLSDSFSLIMVKDMLAGCKSLVSHPKFVRWAVDKHDVLKAAGVLR